MSFSDEIYHDADWITFLLPKVRGSSCWSRFWGSEDESPVVWCGIINDCLALTCRQPPSCATHADLWIQSQTCEHCSTLFSISVFTTTPNTQQQGNFCCWLPLIRSVKHWIEIKHKLWCGLSMCLPTGPSTLGFLGYPFYTSDIQSMMFKISLKSEQLDELQSVTKYNGLAYSTSWKAKCIETLAECKVLGVSKRVGWLDILRFSDV